MASFRPSFIGLALLLFLTSDSGAQSPGTLSFQGRLTDAGGNPINNASQSMTFALYKGATKIWQETQTVNVVDGIYNILLGSVVPVDTIKFNAPIDLGVKVGADAEMTPRTPLVAAALARGLPSLTTYYDEDLTRAGYNLLGGSPVNQIAPGSVGAIVLGGGLDDLAGFKNEVTASFGVVVGGSANRAYYNAAVVGGIGNQADGQESFVGGGNSNKATGLRDAVGGGLFNEATGGHSTVPGGSNNHAHGSYSFAAGYNAHARHAGSFVWSDWSKTLLSDSLYSTAANQFIVRAAGGVGINRAPVGKGIHLKMSNVQGSYGIRTEYAFDTDYWDTYIDSFDDYNFAYNGFLWAFIENANGNYIVNSDARLKDDVQPFDTVLPSVLQLRPSTYRFKDAADASPKTIGLIAQDVEPLFPELVSEKDGVMGMNYAGLGVIAVKAIQELYALVQAQEERLERQEAEIARLTQLVNRR